MDDATVLPPNRQADSENLHATGDLVDNRYLVIRELGRGGMGVVYEVDDTLVSERLALKRLLPGQMDADNVAAFIQAGNSSRKFSGRSKRFVSTHTLGKDALGPYLVLELITAPTLRSLIRDGNIADLETAMAILRDLAVALSDLHEEGYVHRDIKPDNIFVQNGNNVLLADFGISKDMANSAGTMLPGALSRNYGSPEQAKGLPTTQASDIYAFGAVAYELFSGDAPYGAIEPLIEFVPGIGQPLSDLVMRCLAQRPERRPQKGGELVSAIHSLSTGQNPSSSTENTQPVVVQAATPTVPNGVTSAPTIVQNVATATIAQRWQDRYPALAQYIADLRPIPGGDFWMGVTDEDEFLDPDYEEEEDEDGEGPEDYLDDARPRHRVRLSPFRLGHTPVTVSVWTEYCSANGLSMPDVPTWGWVHDHPIVNVSWNDIMGVDGNGGFCAWASRIVGFPVMLPTEAEWEYAAAGGDTGNVFPWGDTFRDAFAWTHCEVSRESTASVRRSTNVCTNSFGLIDMVGNVYQWCRDAYAEYPFEQVQVVRTGVRQVPAHGLAWMLGKTVSEHFEYVDMEELVPVLTVDPGNDIGDLRCVRGGSWGNYNPDIFRCTFRSRNYPDGRHNVNGFRLSAGPK
jgi:formylglycine-generating enzyme required for sulfatase activity